MGYIFPEPGEDHLKKHFYTSRGFNGFTSYLYGGVASVVEWCRHCLKTRHKNEAHAFHKKLSSLQMTGIKKPTCKADNLFHSNHEKCGDCALEKAQLHPCAHLPPSGAHTDPLSSRTTVRVPYPAGRRACPRRFEILQKRMGRYFASEENSNLIEKWQQTQKLL